MDENPYTPPADEPHVSPFKADSPFTKRWQFLALGLFFALCGLVAMSLTTFMAVHFGSPIYAVIGLGYLAFSVWASVRSFRKAKQLLP